MQQAWHFQQTHPPLPLKHGYSRTISFQFALHCRGIFRRYRHVLQVLLLYWLSSMVFCIKHSNDALNMELMSSMPHGLLPSTDCIAGHAQKGNDSAPKPFCHCRE